MILIKNKKRRQSLSILIGASLVAAVLASQPVQAADIHGTKKVAAHTAPTKSGTKTRRPHWGYTGHEGPENWGDLSTDFRKCSSGSTQSPINLEPSEGASVAPILFDYKASPLSIIHNGHTVQISYQPGSTITVGEKKYELLQFHFHTPSEHSLNGHASEMEVHFVHRDNKGNLAVVGVLLNVGEYNMALAELWKRMPARESAEQIYRNVMINAAELLPKRKEYFRYMGSLTTPPCSEGVNWYVLDTPVTIGEAQAKRFSAAVGKNARPIQALNNRLLLTPKN